MDPEVLGDKVRKGYALREHELDFLKTKIEQQSMPKWAVKQFRETHPGSPKDVEEKLNALRQEINLLLKEYPQLNWRPLALAELTMSNSPQPDPLAQGQLAYGEVAEDEEEVVGGSVLKPSWRKPKQRGELRAPGRRPVGFHVCARSSPAITMGMRYPDSSLRFVGPGPGAYSPP